MPNVHCWLIGKSAYPLGTTLRLPASPPLLPSGWLSAGSEPLLLNLAEKLTRSIAPTSWFVRIFDIPAAFDHIVDAPSAAAAPPANALPTPLPEVSCSAKAAGNASPAVSASAIPATAVAIRVR